MRSSCAELIDSFADGTQAGRLVRDPPCPDSARPPVVGNLMGRCCAAAQVLNRNGENWQRIALTAGVLEDSGKSGHSWQQVLQRLALDVGEHCRGAASDREH